MEEVTREVANTVMATPDNECAPILWSCSSIASTGIGLGVVSTFLFFAVLISPVLSSSAIAAVKFLHLRHTSRRVPAPLGRACQPYKEKGTTGRNFRCRYTHFWFLLTAH